MIDKALNALRPGALWSLNGDTYDGLIWDDPSACPTLDEITAWIAVNAVSREMVNAERDRRLRRLTFNGREFDYIDGKGSDQKIAKRGTIAAVAVISAEGWPQTFEWIDADNTKVPMTAKDFLDFSKAAADWENRIVHAARTLKDISPIPADYANDSRW